MYRITSKFWVYTNQISASRIKLPASHELDVCERLREADEPLLRVPALVLLQESPSQRPVVAGLVGVTILVHVPGRVQGLGRHDDRDVDEAAGGLLVCCFIASQTTAAGQRTSLLS